MSSLVYLGLSIILFAITFGISFLMMPMIFGAFFALVDDNTIQLNAEWLAIYNQNKETVQYLSSSDAIAWYCSDSYQGLNDSKCKR
jgi:hypothetical protein